MASMNTISSSGILTFSQRRSLSYRNQSNGFYMITASIMKELSKLWKVKYNANDIYTSTDERRENPVFQIFRIKVEKGA